MREELCPVCRCPNEKHERLHGLGARAGTAVYYCPTCHRGCATIHPIESKPVDPAPIEKRGPSTPKPGVPLDSAQLDKLSELARAYSGVRSTPSWWQLRGFVERTVKAYAKAVVHRFAVQAASSVEAMRDGHTIDVTTGKLVSDPDGPWFLKSDCAAVVRASLHELVEVGDRDGKVGLTKLEPAGTQGLPGAAAVTRAIDFYRERKPCESMQDDLRSPLIGLLCAMSRELHFHRRAAEAVHDYKLTIWPGTTKSHVIDFAAIVTDAIQKLRKRVGEMVTKEQAIDAISQYAAECNAERFESPAHALATVLADHLHGQVVEKPDQVQPGPFKLSPEQQEELTRVVGTKPEWEGGQRLVGLVEALVESERSGSSTAERGNSLRPEVAGSTPAPSSTSEFALTEKQRGDVVNLLMAYGLARPGRSSRAAFTATTTYIEQLVRDEAAQRVANARYSARFQVNPPPPQPFRAGRSEND